MRKSMSKCKGWVVVMYHGAMTPLESYNRYEDAMQRMNAISKRIPTALLNVLSNTYVTSLEVQGKIAWNKSTPY